MPHSEVRRWTLLATLVTATTLVGAVPTVTIASGVIIGTATSVADVSVTVDKYLGVPFAASPTRFQPPAEPTSWSSPYNATNYGPACLQEFMYPEASRNFTMELFNNPPPSAGEDEDCLNLNVYVPATDTRDKVVMVWIYGGSLAFGANSLSFYDGSLFAAKQDVIIVTINYRTNVFGFPNSPELPLTERNLGFLDQRLALQWVQNNIHAFGGSPDRVTIFGESAGAGSVDVLVTTYPQDPPFRAAIMESGQSSFYVNPTNAPSSWVALSTALNCTQTHPDSNLTCLSSAPATLLKSTIERLALAFTPVSDNVTDLRYPNAARLNRNVAQVPVLGGTNANEGSLFTLSSTNGTAYVASTLGTNDTSRINEVLSHYPGLSGAALSSAVNTDARFQCPAAIVANDSSTAGFPAWRYFFNASFPNTTPFPTAGVFHSSEIALVFGTYPKENSTAFQRDLSDYMQTAWATFARNPAGGPGWASVPEIANLGTSGDLISLTTPAKLDQRCELYQPLYEAIGF